MTEVVSTLNCGEAMVLTICRPERRNALTVEVVDALTAGVTDAAAQGARVVVVRGSGETFCAGGDLHQLVSLTAGGAAHVTDVVYSRFHGLVKTLASSRLPVVAAVDGAAVGAGLDLALLCDFRLATSRATFASSWIDVGLVPGMGGAYLLPRILGPTEATDLLLTGRRLGAEEALRLGLLHRVVRPDELDRAVDDLVAGLAAKPAVAVSRTIASMRRSTQAGLLAELDVLGAVQGTLMVGDDFRAATDAFLERS